jgi:hypothetical protein
MDRKSIRVQCRSCAVAVVLLALGSPASEAQQPSVVYNNGLPTHAFNSENNIAYFIGAEDFTLTSTQTIEAVRAWLYGDSGYSGSIAWAIYSNSGNQPGAVLASGNASATFTPTGFVWSDGTPEFQMDFPIPPFTAMASTTYWLGIRNAVPNPENFPASKPNFNWEWTNPNPSLASWFYGYGCCGAPTGWYPLNYSGVGLNQGSEHAFELLGIPSPQAPITINLATTTSPTAAQPGVTTLTLTCSALPSGAITPANLNVTLQAASGNNGPNLTANVTGFSTIPPTSGRITFQVNGSNVSAPTPYLVSVTGTTSTGTAFASGKPAALTINPAAAILSLNPSSGPPGQIVSVTITTQYTNFVQGSTVANFGPSISVGGGAAGQAGLVTVTSPTTATAQITIAANAVPGAQTVTVSTGVQQASSVRGFTITGASPAPLIAAVSPNSGQQGQQNLPVVITGQNTHFVQGTSQVSFGPDVTISSVTVASATSLTANVTIPASANLGGHTVTVTTGSETVSLPNGFNVTSSTQLSVSAGPNQNAQLPFLGLPQQYTSVTLPTLGGANATAEAINDAGDLAGSAQDTNGHYQPVIWRSGKAIQIPTLGGTEGAFKAINIYGQGAGQSQDATGNWRDFYFDGVKVWDIGPSEHGCCTWAMGINRLGAVVGLTSFTSPAFLYSSGTLTALPGLPGSTGAHAQQINDAGLIVGRDFIGNDEYPVAWSAGQVQQLALLPGFTTGTAYSVNNTGDMAGTVWPTSGSSQAVLWRNGNVLPLPGLTYADSINNSRQIVALGATWVVWQDGKTTDLTPYVPCNSFVVSATSNSGLIAGYCYPSGSSFSLTPNGQTVSMPQVTLTLNGAVSTNGTPPIAPPTIQWIEVSGPAPVVFANASQAITAATFVQAGTYVLRLTATFSHLSSSADVTITIEKAQRPPSINAGPDQTILYPGVASLSASVTEDALPPGQTLTVNWLMISGPGAVTLAQPSSANTTATFTQPGAIS